ncbi:838e2045-93fa-43bd-99ab-00429dc195d1 [Sclerotinia trifoliorum]|uniref:838e2045-93fa-43bd-99ab-00429dc195d1 n=1 Tax=Sclerotinia trifoliorum TaxID=28548 RepID=A0A8H2ZJR5_9HELO|nr:838e2045-93fa-43bd-99ab-00429dc195d1 [Sclerotinia trifoliorum]
MAVLVQVIAKRQSNDFDDENDNCDYYGNCYSTWGSWGRWVVLVLIILAFVLLAFGLSCLNSRRRRRQGVQPMYGTGWMAKPPPYGHYNQPGAYNYGPPPPMYTQNGPIPPQQTGNTFNSNDGYYGHHGQPVQQEGIELQQPPHAYTRGGEDVYQAPTGPPPGKMAEGDGIIR